MKPKEWWILNDKCHSAADIVPDEYSDGTRVIEYAAYRDLLSKYNLAITALAGCVDDRHYGGVYPRHTEILKILSGD